MTLNKMACVWFQGDIFGGLNSGLQDGLLSRAEALAADLGKHNGGTPMPLKHDPVSVYHHGAHMATPHPNNRPHHQVQSHLFVSAIENFLIINYILFFSNYIYDSYDLSKKNYCLSTFLLLDILIL